MTRFERKELLFIWDGLRKSVAIADRYMESNELASVACLHVLPHEAIHGYSTPGLKELPPSPNEIRLRKSFAIAAKATDRLKGQPLQIVFGDRVGEILHYAKAFKASVILLPCFHQSRFSSWIHGDLNQRIVKKAGCEMVFYESDSADPIVTDHDLSKRTRNTNFQPKSN